MSNPITVSRVADETVALISMDDGKVNALTRSNISAIIDALNVAEADESVVAAVIAGRKDRFCAGFDLEVFQSGDVKAVVDLVADGGELVRTIYGCGLPVVAACTGHGVAAGALMLLGADVRVGADGPYKIGLNEVAIGLTLPTWAHTIADERLSNRHIQRAIANAHLTDPQTAIDVGFLDRVVPADKVVDAAIEEAAAMATLDRAAYQRTMTGFRRKTLRRMQRQIADDRKQ